MRDVIVGDGAVARGGVFAPQDGHEELLGKAEAMDATWELIKRDSLLPEGGRPKHLLWALHFMKVYPKQSPGCSTVGASAGAIDPKTHQKWVWLLIDALVGLMDVVVSKITM